jgi:3-hydroxyacyl-CoA dehydrogenase
MTIGIVGAGRMGRRVAEAAAAAGFETVLVKATPGDLAPARRAIAESLGGAVRAGTLSEVALEATLGRLTLTRELDALVGCGLVIECVVEELEAKQRALALVEARVATATVLASSSAALPLAALAEGLRAPMRFLGLRFVAPADGAGLGLGLGLVEIGVTPRTYPNAVELAQQVVSALGTRPVMVGHGFRAPEESVTEGDLRRAR